MYFPNTESMMKDLQHVSRIHLEQVMQLIEKLFTDIQYQTGDLVEDCQIENMNLLVPTLSAVTNDIVYIFRNHEKAISDAQHKYFGSLTKAQSACAACQEELNTVHQTIQSLEKEEAELTARMREAELQRNAAEKLERRIQDLQMQINQLNPADSSSKAGLLREKITAQESALQKLISQFDKDQKSSVVLQDQITAQQQEISRTTQEIDHRRGILCALEAQLQSLRNEENQLNQTIADSQQQVRDSKEQQRAKTEQLERIRAVIALCDEELKTLNADLARLSSEESDKRLEINLVQEQLNALKSRLEAQEKLFAEQQDELHNAQTRLKHAQESLQQIRTAAADIHKQILSAEQVLSDEQTLAENLKTQLFNINSDVDYQKSDNDNFRKSFLEPAEALLAELKKQYDADQKRYKDLESELNQIKELRKGIVTAITNLEQSIRHAQSELQKKDELHRQFREELRILEAALAEKNSAVEELVATQNKLRELLNGRDTDQIQKDLEEQNRQLKERICQADNLEVRIREVQGELNTAQERLDSAQSKLNELLDQEKVLRDDLDDVTAQLDQVNSEENRARSASLQNQLDILHSLADRLCLGNSKACGDKFFLDRQVCDSLNTAEQTIQTIRQAICEYAGHRQSALEVRD